MYHREEKKGFPRKPGIGLGGLNLTCSIHVTCHVVLIYNIDARYEWNKCEKDTRLRWINMETWEHVRKSAIETRISRNVRHICDPINVSNFIRSGAIHFKIKKKYP